MVKREAENPWKLAGHLVHIHSCLKGSNRLEGAEQLGVYSLTFPCTL